MSVAAAQANQQLIDELLDFGDPAASEARFRAAAADAPPGQRRDVLATQIARALGLRGQFDDALALLDEVAARAFTDPETVVRLALERGRVVNSSGSPVDARPLLEAAFERASADGLEHLAIDALHMVAIVAPAEEQVALNEQALSLASIASDPRARDWRASLLNNLGWTRFDSGELDDALALFTDAVEERIRQGKAREIAVARWSVGRTLRALGRTEEALAAQGELAAWLSKNDLSDSYVEEEIGECLAALGRADEAAAHFASAADLLEAAGPGEEEDPERLARLRGLADQSITTPEPGTG